MKNSCGPMTYDLPDAHQRQHVHEIWDKLVSFGAPRTQEALTYAHDGCEAQ